MIIGLNSLSNFSSGNNLTKGEIYDLLYNEALKVTVIAAKIVSINYFSGEPVTGFSQGRPMVLRSENLILILLIL